MSTSEGTFPSLQSIVQRLSSEECMVTLAKVLDNIITEPNYNKKTRKLKLSNNTFARRVARHEGGIDFLRICQFSQRGQLLELKKDQESKLWLWEARKALNEHAMGLKLALPPLPDRPDNDPVDNLQRAPMTEMNEYPVMDQDDPSTMSLSIQSTADDLEAEIMKELNDDLPESPSLLDAKDQLQESTSHPERTDHPQGDPPHSDPPMVIERKPGPKEDPFRKQEEPSSKEEKFSNKQTQPSRKQEEHLTNKQEEVPTNKQVEQDKVEQPNDNQEVQLSDKEEISDKEQQQPTDNKEEPTVAAGESKSLPSDKTTVRANRAVQMPTVDKVQLQPSDGTNSDDEFANALSGTARLSEGTSDHSVATSSSARILNLELVVEKPNVIIMDVAGGPEDDEGNVVGSLNMLIRGSPKQDCIVDFFSGRNDFSGPRKDPEEPVPQRRRVSPIASTDDLENEMAKLLAESSEMDVAAISGIEQRNLEEVANPRCDDQRTVVTSNEVKNAHVPMKDHTLDNSSQDSLDTVGVQDPERNSAEDLDYTSIHAHSDWYSLHELMVRYSLHHEYEMCWGSLCTLSVVCADLPVEELGIKVQSKKGKRERSNSKRAWLPLEMVQGLWKLVLLDSGGLDETRITFVCSRLSDVLVESEYLELYERGGDAVGPHSTWIRVRKEKMVLLGYGLKVSIEQQATWMRRLASVIMEDMNFWYGRYALLTIALAGDDDFAMAGDLLKDVDFVQSRLDIIGMVTGTRRHVQDCKSYVKGKKEAFRNRKISIDEVKLGLAEQIGYDVALDGCQQVAISLYKTGQVLAKGRGSPARKVELATALHVLGMAVGEWEDYDFEIQLYQKAIKVLKDAGDFPSERAADTFLSMGACSLGHGNFNAAMGFCEEALDIYKSRLGEKHINVAKALHHIGVVHCERAELDLAMESLKTALKIRQGHDPGDNYDEGMAETLCWIGKVYSEQGLPEKAKKYFNTARDIKEELYGADSVEVAEILHNIAVIHDDDQDFEKSLKYYRRCLQIRRAALGDEHEDVSDVLMCIGTVYRSMGDDDTALQAYRKALELRTLVARSITLDRVQTKSLIAIHEDVLGLLRRQAKKKDSSVAARDVRGETASILLKMGHLHDTIEQFERSIRCFEKALKIRLQSGDNVGAGQALNVIGISLAKRRKYHDAMSNFEQALTLRRAALGEGHIDVAETLHNMGNCAAKSGDFNEARTYYDESLRIKRKHLGNSHPSVAQTLHNIGNVLSSQGSNDSAMKHYEEALALRKKLLGSDHVDIAYSLHCIAKIHRKKHNVDAARECFSQALKIKRARLGGNHSSVAETLEQMGSLYMEIGDDDEAATCLTGALNIYKTKSRESMKIAEVHEALGSKFERKGQNAKAMMYFNKALKARTKSLGQDNASVADLHYRVGKLQTMENSYHDALVSFQSATRIRKKAIGRNDLTIANILSDAGQLQLKLKQIDVAERCFMEALRIRRHILDGRHEKIGECLLCMGDIAVEKGDFPQSIESFSEAMEIFRLNDGMRSPLAADACQRLGVAFRLANDLEKSQEYFEKCLETRVAILGEDAIEVAQTNHALGEVHFKNESYTKAEELFRDSVEVKVNKLGEDHPDVAATVMMLGRTCTKLDCPDEAMMYFEQARLTMQQHLGDSHLEVAEVGREIGLAHVVKKEYEEGLECFHSYLRTRRSAVGDDEIVSDVLHDIGSAEYELKRYDEALKSFASALALYRVLLGDEHLSVAKTLYSLGLVYDAKREFKESMRYHKEAFRLRRRLLGADHMSVAQSLDCISALYMKQPNLEKAMQSMKEGLRIRTQKLGKTHIDVATSLFGMGVIFAEMGDLEKAMECYGLSLDIRTDKLGEGSIEVAQNLHNMGTVLAKQQDYELALDHWRRALVSYRAAGQSDEDHLVAVTIGNINMAESFLDERKF